MRLRRISALSAVFLLVIPGIVAAGTPAAPNVTWPNDKDTLTHNIASVATGRQWVRLQVGGHCPDLKIDRNWVVGGHPGQEVGRITINDLCSLARANGYSASGISVDGAPCAGAACCSAALDAATQWIDFRQDCEPGPHPNPGQGFTLRRTGGTGTVEVIPNGVQVKHFTTKTNAGNTRIHDLLPRFNMRLSRQGEEGQPPVDGVFTATFGIDPNTVYTVSVDSNDPNVVDPNATDTVKDEQLNDALTAKIAALGLGLDFRGSPGYGAEAVSDSADFFTKGPFLHLASVTRTPVTTISVSGPVGSSTVADMNQAGALIPTLSEWGLILLVAVLFLTGLWMLRRRRLGEAA